MDFVKRGEQRGLNNVCSQEDIDLHAQEYRPRVYETRTFSGVVVAVDDPLRLGRVKVRVYQIHGLEETDIKAEFLPWAIPMHNGGTKESGGFNVPPLGSSVWVEFFLGDVQQPMYALGHHGLIDAEDRDAAGVTPSTGDPVDEDDPDPTNEVPSVFRGYQPQAMRARKGFDGFTLDWTTWYLPVTYVAHEPPNPYHPDVNGVNAEVYPGNRGFKTPSGIVVEFDDANTRIHVWHPKGTYLEIDADGNLVTKVAGKTYMQVDGDVQQHIKGDRLTYIEGDDVVQCQDYRVRCRDMMVDAQNIVTDSVTAGIIARSSGDLL